MHTCIYKYIYTKMELMTLRRHSPVKVSVVLTIADHLFIHNYIRSLQNLNSKYYVKTYFNCPEGASTYL